MKLWLMNGAGNSFAVIDARGSSLDMSEMARQYCSFYKTDGFMALDSSEIADFKLHFYNSDGSRADMCGNGARCICRFAYDNKITPRKMRVETDVGLISGERISESLYKISLNPPAELSLDGACGVPFVRVGVPHLVEELDGLDFSNCEALLPRARELRHSPALENGANVNFFFVCDENTVRLLTYERGVEGFTLACGTGSGAVTAILWSEGRIKGDSLRVINRGGALSVSVVGNREKKQIEALYLEGSAELDQIIEL